MSIKSLQGRRQYQETETNRKHGETHISDTETQSHFIETFHVITSQRLIFNIYTVHGP